MAKREKALEVARAAIWLCGRFSALQLAQVLEALPDECMRQFIAAAQAVEGEEKPCRIRA